MADRPIVNTPGADQLVRLLRGALKQEPLFAAPVLVPWRELLTAMVARLDAAIAPRVKQVGVPAARAAATAADGEHDRSHRFFYGLVSAFSSAPDPAQRAAAALVLATLYPDKLLVVNAAWADEVAAGPTFAKKLALPEVGAALATLAPEVPHLRAAADAVVSAAAALGRALDEVDAALVDDAGKTSSELFMVRVQAHQQLALFVQVVSNVAYPGDSPEDRAARLALIGPYLRYLAAVPGGRATGVTGDAPMAPVVDEAQA
ncbi:MAG: hypothetical protein CVU56_15730 [Deltaproteobacteria bacterium HGW-Deltaproteobacteria-14]|jgi:hypothetical protein|nr:MAG: hypothetical protein CVU56_15730 [Deltaproteobacteria bacterium HGW-Deltaproteobacteria-14]